MDGNLYRWAERAADTLGVPAWAGEQDTVTAILDLSKDAAHRVARPAAPITSFLAGVAVGLAGAGGPEDLARAIELLRAQLPDAPAED